MDAIARLGRPVQVNLPFAMIDAFGPLVIETAGLGVEIGLDAATLEETPLEVFEVWAGRLAGRELTVHAPFMDLSPGGIDSGVVELTRRRLLKAVEAAAIFEAKAITGHAYYDATRYPHHLERWLETSLETWNLVLEASEKLGAVVALENVYETDPEMIARLLNRAAHPRLAFCFDTGHFNVWSKAPLEEWLEALGGRIARLHLHDNDGSFDHHWPIGRGDFPFERLFAWLKDRGVEPGVTLEPHRAKDVAPSLDELVRLLESCRSA